MSIRMQVDGDEEECASHLTTFISGGVSDKSETENVDGNTNSVFKKMKLNNEEVVSNRCGNEDISDEVDAAAELLDSSVNQNKKHHPAVNDVLLYGELFDVTLKQLKTPNPCYESLMNVLYIDFKPSLFMRNGNCFVTFNAPRVPFTLSCVQHSSVIARQLLSKQVVNFSLLFIMREHPSVICAELSEMVKRAINQQAEEENVSDNWKFGLNYISQEIASQRLKMMESILLPLASNGRDDVTATQLMDVSGTDYRTVYYDKQVDCRQHSLFLHVIHYNGHIFTFLGPDAKSANENAALYCLKYVVKYYLNISKLSSNDFPEISRFMGNNFRQKISSLQFSTASVSSWNMKNAKIDLTTTLELQQSKTIARAEYGIDTDPNTSHLPQSGNISKASGNGDNVLIASQPPKSEIIIIDNNTGGLDTSQSSRQSETISETERDISIGLLQVLPVKKDKRSVVYYGGATTLLPRKTSILKPEYNNDGGGLIRSHLQQSGNISKASGNGDNVLIASQPPKSEIIIIDNNTGGLDTSQSSRQSETTSETERDISSIGLLQVPVKKDKRSVVYYGGATTLLPRKTSILKPEYNNDGGLISSQPHKSATVSITNHIGGMDALQSQQCETISKIEPNVSAAGPCLQEPKLISNAESSSGRMKIFRSVKKVQYYGRPTARCILKRSCSGNDELLTASQPRRSEIGISVDGITNSEHTPKVETIMGPAQLSSSSSEHSTANEEIIAQVCGNLTPITRDSFETDTIANKISYLVLLKYLKLRATYSEQYPRNDYVISGIVMVKDEDFDNGVVITVCTGNKMVSKIDTVNAESMLIDMHGEITCRRALVHYLYDQLELLLSPRSNRVDDTTTTYSSIFEEIEGNAKQFRLKSNISFHLYISSAPCGDSRLFAKNQTRNPLKRRNAGSLRVKLQRGFGAVLTNQYSKQQLFDSIKKGDEPLISMCCSDKLLKRNILGVQGSVLGNLVQPIYYNSIIIGKSNCDLYDCQRALYNRIASQDGGENIINHPYRMNMPLVDSTVNELNFTRTSTKFCFNWIINEDGIEVINSKTGKTEFDLESRLCKQTLFHKFLRVLYLSGMAGPDQSFEYKHFKQNAVLYRTTMDRLMEFIETNNLGHWSFKPPEFSSFSLQCKI